MCRLQEKLAGKIVLLLVLKIQSDTRVVFLGGVVTWIKLYRKNIEGRRKRKKKEKEKEKEKKEKEKEKEKKKKEKEKKTEKKRKRKRKRKNENGKEKGKGKGKEKRKRKRKSLNRQTLDKIKSPCTSKITLYHMNR